MLIAIFFLFRNPESSVTSDIADIAVAACRINNLLIRFSPAISTTEDIMVMSFTLICLESSLATTVERHNLGMPKVTFCIASKMIKVPPPPPIPITPFTKFLETRSARISAAPFPISSTAFPRSPDSRIACKPTPEAAATTSLPICTSKSTNVSITPTLIVINGCFSLIRKSTRNVKSSPFVSKQPRTTILFSCMPNSIIKH